MPGNLPLLVQKLANLKNQTYIQQGLELPMTCPKLYRDVDQMGRKAIVVFDNPIKFGK
jgi:hypothetical protein